MSGHLFCHVKWLHGVSLKRCSCGVEQIRQESDRSSVTRDSRKTVYRRAGEDDTAWTRTKLPHEART